MLLVTLALLAAQAAEPPPDDILVVGRRLDTLRFEAHLDRRGRLSCRIRRSSGDGALDIMVCAAVRECAAGATRESAEMQSCIRERILARFAELQAAERQPAETPQAGVPPRELNPQRE